MSYFVAFHLKGADGRRKYHDEVARFFDLHLGQ